MKVCGFTIIRNAIKYDYPVIESISSILPICDKFIVCVGDSEDDSESLIRAINSPKIEIINSVWDDNLREGGRVLSVETNKAFDAISNEFDWCFYLQSDEVVHEKYLDTIKIEMEKYLKEKNVDGLLFKYLHFYGSYAFIADSRSWYRREIRIIRNNKNIRSYKDAQGFRWNDGRKLNTKLIDACVYHYGWVKNPVFQKKKEWNFHKYWHNDEWIKNNVKQENEFNYSDIDSLSLFNDEPPMVMEHRIKNQDWSFDFDVKHKKLSTKKKILHWFEKLTGIRLFEYRNYKLV